MTSQSLAAGPPPWNHKDLLAVGDLDAPSIRTVLDTAAPFREVAGRTVKKVPTLRGRTVFQVEVPPVGDGVSHRPTTALDTAAFQLAARRLSADCVAVDAHGVDATSTVALSDLLASLGAMAADLIVLRHPEAGLVGRLAAGLGPGLINAGDGAHEEPIWGLAVAFTLRRLRGNALAGARYALIGDLLTSGAARSALLALAALGAEVVVAGLHGRLPPGLEAMGATVADSVDQALEGADGVLVIPPSPARVGRHGDGWDGEGRDYPSFREYFHLAGLTAERLSRAQDNAPVLHYGPPVRGVSVAADVAAAVDHVLDEQTADALAVRMAALYLLAGWASASADGRNA